MFDKKLLLQHINNQDLSERRDHTIQGRNESDEDYEERMARRSRNERHSSDVQIHLTNAARRRRGMPDLAPEKIKGTVQNKQAFGMRTAAKQYADRFGPDGTFVSNYSPAPTPATAPEEVKQAPPGFMTRSSRNPLTRLKELGIGFGGSMQEQASLPMQADYGGAKGIRKPKFKPKFKTKAKEETPKSKPGAIKKKAKGIKGARANAGLIGAALKGLMTPGYQNPDTPPPARSSGGY